ncbi:LysR family transcriptional regulator [Hyphomonas sp.]|uniref:LysR family transcriptional regulator n=1 Tax=Hyphomonas sp. TaxID=87 RepID=UPI0025C13F56|nr:LysR family transcriptional regulator [Hyphomonas sp.]
MDNIAVYQTFARLLERQSFSAVAAELGVTQSTISKQISALEDHLGVQLFVRTTRSITPTMEAQELAGLVQELLEKHAEVRSFARGGQPEPAGLLRISAPVSYGHMVLYPQLSDFRKKFHSVEIDLLLSDTPESALPEHVEIAVLMGQPSALSIRIRAIGTYERVVVCSNEYANSFGTPTEPIDLENHTIILAKGASEERFDFESETGRQSVTLKPVFATNDELLAYKAARAGEGITIVPSWIVKEDIDRGKIVHLLSNFYLPEISMYLAYPQAKYISLRARALIDYLTSNLRKS